MVSTESMVIGMDVWEMEGAAELVKIPSDQRMSTVDQAAAWYGPR